ncbi:putative competence protein CinA [Venustampulla echinocandica]|uniref:Putative competence protein CinA n=1 Tax=Venustampulla echinocandica TaxID=2656787 RepID=A0A370U3V0_9HELO|nr:putative competence protein CinA [Venustampulla echinocandica]RDL42455.1 putative competence protein CinA [Venustampulla echinocandica]
MAKVFPPEKLRGVAAEVAALLKEKRQSVCVGETAAGGIISASLLSTPGASGFYKGGLTSDANQLSNLFGNTAGWTQENITNYRGPTPDIVAGLATNVRAKLGATYCISESGTAGPTGGNTPNRTPGYLALAVATDDGKVYKKETNTGLGGDREANMIAFAEEALSLLRDVIKGDTKL